MPQNPATTVAIVLARGGSKGIPAKNLRKVGGRSLVGRSVTAANNAASVTAVYVSTDDAAIAAEARRHGALIVDRPADISGDTASSEIGWLHALEVIRRDLPSISRLVLLQCTSPFTTGSDIDACLAAMESKQAACALSVVRDHSFLWTLDAQGMGKGVNHDETKQRQRRQELPPAFRENGAIYCVRVDDFARVGRRFCGPVALHVVDHPPLEIDSSSDLELCNMIANSHQHCGAAPDLSMRLGRVKALVMDFDGVHTDDKVAVDQNGVESVTVSRRDGLGLELLRNSRHLRLLIVSKERNPVVSRRAEKLNIECLQARDDKIAALDDWLNSTALGWDDVLYVGNDVNDLGPIRRAALSACPQDAHHDVLDAVDWIVPVDGGNGVLRFIVDQLLRTDRA